MGASFVLCIETSSKLRSQIALGKVKAKGDFTDWSTVNLGTKVGQGEQLCAAIGSMLKKKNTPISAIEKIFVSSGPGSFTGIRIGMATAFGMALTHNIPVVSVPTLPCLTLGAFQGIGGDHLVFLPLIKAQKGQLSGSLMQYKGGKFEVLIPTTTATPEIWVDLTASSKTNEIVIFGEGFLDFQKEFKKAMAKTQLAVRVFSASWKFHYPQAKTLAAFDGRSQNPSDTSILYPRPGHLEFRTA